MAPVPRKALGFLITLGLALTWAQAARAERVVVLHESAGLRPGLCSALRIQFADLGQIECVPPETQAALSERLEQAAAEVRKGPVRLAVLLERDPDPALVRMYIVGSRGDQAVVSIEREKNRPEPDVDRSLALKVRAALEAVQVVEQSQAEREAGSENQAVLAGSLAAAPASAVRALRVSGALEVGGGVSLGDHTRGFGQVGMLGRLSLRALRLELGPTARWFSGLHASGKGGSVEESEWSLGLSLRGLWSWARRVELGGSLEPTWLAMRARGTAMDGTRGERRLSHFSMTLGLEARLLLFAQLFLRCAPALEIAAVSERFEVGGVRTLALPRARFLLPVSLWVGWP
jgi:hypothetical protein